jgi:hypothetical protein
MEQMAIETVASRSSVHNGLTIFEWHFEPDERIFIVWKSPEEDVEFTIRYDTRDMQDLLKKKYLDSFTAHEIKSLHHYKIDEWSEEWVGLSKKGFIEVGAKQKDRFHIPPDLVPETAAVSATAAISVIGSVVIALATGTISGLFLAPLIVSAAGGLFIIEAVRRQR